jgi:hypothetical protein
VTSAADPVLGPCAAHLLAPDAPLQNELAQISQELDEVRGVQVTLSTPGGPAPAK